MEKYTADKLKKMSLCDIAKLFTNLTDQIYSLRNEVNVTEVLLYEQRRNLTEKTNYRDQLIKDITVYSTEGNYDHG